MWTLRAHSVICEAVRHGTVSCGLLGGFSSADSYHLSDEQLSQ